MNERVELVVQSLKDGAARIQQSFTQPDDDWQGVFVFTGEDEINYYLPATFGDDNEKTLFAHVLIPTIIRKQKPSIVCSVLSAWTIKISAPEGFDPDHPPETYADLHEPRPSEHPDRMELLILTAITAERVQMWTAKIVRNTKQPPTLDPWKLWPDDSGSSGQFIEPIQQTLREVGDAS